MTVVRARLLGAVDGSTPRPVIAGVVDAPGRAPTQLDSLTYRTTETPEGGYDWRQPPPDSIELDPDHRYVKLWWPNHPYPQAGHPDDAAWVGIDEWHRTADGRWCVGYCLFAVPAADEWAAAYVGGMTTRWQVTFDPLTMSPSIACRVCPSHGFIRQGRWTS